MMKKILVVLVLVATSGCWYSKSAGEDLEEFVKEQAAMNDWMRQHKYLADDPGIDPDYVKKLRDSIKNLCVAANIPPEECDKYDPGDGDKTGTPPDPPGWPRP